MSAAIEHKIHAPSRGLVVESMRSMPLAISRGRVTLAADGLNVPNVVNQGQYLEECKTAGVLPYCLSLGIDPSFGDFRNGEVSAFTHKLFPVIDTSDVTVFAPGGRFHIVEFRFDGSLNFNSQAWTIFNGDQLPVYLDHNYQFKEINLSIRGNNPGEEGTYDPQIRLEYAVQSVDTLRLASKHLRLMADAETSAEDRKILDEWFSELASPAVEGLTTA